MGREEEGRGEGRTVDRGVGVCAVYVLVRLADINWEWCNRRIVYAGDTGQAAECWVPIADMDRGGICRAPKCSGDETAGNEGGTTKSSLLRNETSKTSKH